MNIRRKMKRIYARLEEGGIEHFSFIHISWYKMFCTWPLFIGLHTLQHEAMVTRIEEVHND